MGKLLACFEGAILLALTCVSVTAVPLPSQEMKALSKRHKEQQKMLKQQQRAMKAVMAKHDQSPDARKRFKSDLKMQRQMLRKSQKDETRRMKEHQKSLATRPPSS